MNQFLFKNYIQKIILFNLISGLLFFGAGLIYNRNSAVLRAEEKPIICKKQAEIKLPLGITFQLGPNESEIPIGETTDKTESAAEKIISQLNIIINVSEKEIEAAERIAMLAKECSLDNCDPGNCEEEWEDVCNCEEEDPDTGNCLKEDCTPVCAGCNVTNCSGNACPQEIYDWWDNEDKGVKQQAQKIKDAYNEINKFFTEKKNPPIGKWWEICCPVFGICENPNCRTEIETLSDLLERSRSGDYKVWNTLTGKMEWYHNPSGLKDCVVRPEDQEAVLRGEKTGKFLLGCKEALSAGLLDECYGQAECIYKKEEGISESELKRTLLCPRSENYYCCE